MLRLKSDSLPWSKATTLKEWAEKELKAGRVEEVRKLVRTLPESRRAEYRELAIRIRQEQKAGAR